MLLEKRKRHENQKEETKKNQHFLANEILYLELSKGWAEELLEEIK